MRDEVFDATIGVRIRDALASQGLLRHMGAEVEDVSPGALTMSLPYRSEVAQQHGFFHGGAIGFLIDNTTTACAGTVLREPGQAVLTAEYKLNIVAPGVGARLVCRATVIKPGRMLIPVEAKVFAQDQDGAEKLVAVGLATIAVIDAARVGGKA